MSNMKKIIAILCALTLAFAGGLAVGLNLTKSGGDEYDVATLQEKIVEMSELTTLELEYTDQGTFKGEAKKFLGYDIPGTSKAMQLEYSGIIKAGSVLKDNVDVDIDGDTITVRVPHSEILSHEIDEDSIKIVYLDNGIFNKVTPKETNALRKKTKAAKQASVLKTDFLNQADHKAVSQITTFLETACPDAEVTVEFK